jgi:hypothetical protein
VQTKREPSNLIRINLRGPHCDEPLALDVVIGRPYRGRAIWQYHAAFIRGIANAAGHRQVLQSPGPASCAAATSTSSHATRSRLCRSARTGGRETKIIRLRGPVCHPARSGGVGPITRPQLETQTAGPPKPRPTSPTRSALRPSAPPRSSAWHDVNAEKGNHASSGNSATTLSKYGK